MKRWIAVLPLAVLVALGALFWLFALNCDPEVRPDALVGKPMPALTLDSLDDGSPISLRSEASSGPMLVNFFASWCGPCRIEQPVLMDLKAQGVRIVGIAYEDVPPRGSPEDAKRFLAQLGDPFSRRAVDPEGMAGIEFGITGVPETFVIDTTGKIVAKHTGPLDAESARKLVRQLK